MSNKRASTRVLPGRFYCPGSLTQRNTWEETLIRSHKHFAFRLNRICCRVIFSTAKLDRNLHSWPIQTREIRCSAACLSLCAVGNKMAAPPWSSLPKRHKRTSLRIKITHSQSAFGDSAANVTVVNRWAEEKMDKGVLKCAIKEHWKRVLLHNQQFTIKMPIISIENVMITHLKYKYMF